MRTLTVLSTLFLLLISLIGGAQTQNTGIDSFGVSVMKRVVNDEDTKLIFIDKDLEQGRLDQTIFTIVHWQGNYTDTVVYVLMPSLVDEPTPTKDLVYTNLTFGVMRYRAVHQFALQEMTTTDRKRKVTLVANVTFVLQ